MDEDGGGADGLTKLAGGVRGLSTDGLNSCGGAAGIGEGAIPTLVASAVVASLVLKDYREVGEGDSACTAHKVVGDTGAVAYVDDSPSAGVLHFDGALDDLGVRCDDAVVEEVLGVIGLYAVAASVGVRVAGDVREA